METPIDERIALTTARWFPKASSRYPYVSFMNKRYSMMGIMARRKGIGGDETEAKEAQTSVSRPFCQNSFYISLI
jgi:hypothetical protein